ncbi:endonuclease/exonuclease/phosphatase family protein [Nonomuraea africana]|uniref:Endonuclease/exonuclease/phosphatase (EEP) superfamily protein YafD n=1 Tax=Nonomuraea africana TaxID=46171 RepID=A0ABR9K8V0_9ACTN|nr:endonuclease/exonuclease/phosphatase family protein [Nonomuraea africana]MBE1558442.1 endonuclease/exonuclease/phosphatase (EEP) superfamily protein YafD [Nonomuraea africana]
MIATEKSQRVTGPTTRRARRRRMSWLVAAVFAAWAVVRVFGLEHGSFLTQLMTLTPYALVAGAVAAVTLALRRRAAAVLALAACVALAAAVLPRAFAEPPTARGPVLKVLSINLFSRADAQAVVSLVRELDPDVFSALELGPETVRRLDAAGLDTLMPHRVLQPARGATGSGLFAKHPLTELKGLFTPIGHNMPAATVTLPSGVQAQVVAIHPNPPLGSMAAEWNASLAAMPPPSPDVVRVLAGDFNASLDHRAMRDLLAKGYVDAAEAAGVGLTPTWPHGRLLPPLVTIDHVLADRRVGVARVEVRDVPRTDHRAVFAELRLP